MAYQKTTYRYLLFLFSSIFLQLEANTSITDRAGITRVTVAKIVKPTTLHELRGLVQYSQGHLSIAGERFSQGGQIAYPQGTVIDMSYLNRILNFDKTKKLITVQAGATWRSIQEFIDAHNLSIKVMQSYNDFSVGGSLSVNVHARDICCGSLIGSVESITVLLADGRLLKASRSENSDLFYAAIGGYGLLGVIVDATIRLTANSRIMKKVQIINAIDYPDLFKKILRDPNVVFQNADIFPMAFNKALSITWTKTNEITTIDDRLQTTSLFKRFFKKACEVLLRRIPFLKRARPTVDAKLGQEKIVVMRNYEMSYSTDQLALSPKLPTRMTLQEYFVPLN